MTVPVHRLYWLTVVVLSAVALSACGMQDRGTAGLPPLADYAGAGAGDASGGATGGSEPLQADAVEPLGGRATYEGTAGGLYAVGELSIAYRYFGAFVRLTADLRDNYIWGAITDGRDTLTLEQIFERLTLEPAALDADETAFFDERLTGVVSGKLFTGEWSGRFSGGGAASVDPRGAVAGTFWAESDDLGEGLVGFFDAAYQAHTNRTVEALNALSERTKGRLASSMATTARTNAVSSTDAPDTGVSDAGDVSWNTGVTQSSRNTWFDGVQVNLAINARYEGDTLAFDRMNLSSQPPVRLATSDEPEAPGYRQVISPMRGSPRWKGVEYLSIDSSRRWNYSILFSDISDNGDADYLAGGFSISLPDLDDPSDTQMPWFTVAASGNDPFQPANIESLEGEATYDGDATGLYASKIATRALRYFNADVRLTANFGRHGITGVVSEGRDTATNELIFKELGLRSGGWATEQTASFRGWVSGVVNGRVFTGNWGGQYFGNGESATDLPGSVAGSFGARSEDGTESLMGFFGAYDRELTRLPSGQGLSVGRIVVRPGESVEHGDVSISCPEGGLACIVTVEADGAAFYDRDGGIASLESVHGGHWQDNPGAEDLLDHWNDPARLREAMGLTAVSEGDSTGRRTALQALLERTGGDSVETGTKLRNVSAEDIEILGERDGITYGRWRGGPAGTLNIEFDWRFAPNFDSETHARMERAGKSWSWRLLDDFGTHVAEEGTRVHSTGPTESVILDQDLTANDVLILLFDLGDTSHSSAGALYRERIDDDYEPWLGRLMLSQNHVQSTSVMVHEVGHVMGVSGWHVQPLTRYINTEDGTFEGPEAMRANAGAAVPFQRLAPGLEPVTPDTPGAQVDYGHLGACTSVMAYCNQDTLYSPSAIDFAYLADIGYEILDAETAALPELYGYGAWGRYSAWGAGVERTIQYEGGDFVEARDSLRAGANAFGTVPGVALGEGATPLQGSVTWSGSLIGVDLGQAMLPPVFGDAELSVELSSLDGTARFDDLTVYVDGVSSDFRVSSREYAIDVAGNSFSDEDGRVRGGFFGPAHEEMAGVLDDRTVEVNLLAGFGGKR